MNLIRQRRKTILLVPRLNNEGGIASYYRALRPFWGNSFEFFFRGKESGKSNLLRVISDYIRFVTRVVISGHYHCVLINTSLGVGGFVRDGLFCLLTPKSSKRIVFFRGWDPAFEKKVSTGWIESIWVRWTFLKADHIVVLASHFKKVLESWGYQQNITLETTAVDNNLLAGFDWDNLFSIRKNKKQINLLYLGYVSKAKGVDKLVEAFKCISGKENNKKVCLTIAGDGLEREILEKNAENYGLDIVFSGYVKNQKKIETYRNAHLYIFPSLHEGMPNSLLEAMAFGLPILTTKVGGIPDFFEEGKMGFYIKKSDSISIAEKIEYLLKQPDLMKQISKYNFEYARENFYASRVAERLNKIIDDVQK